MRLHSSESYRGYSINIYYNPASPSPREWDNLGTMYTAHRRYCPEKEFDCHFNINDVFDKKIGNFKQSFLQRYIALPIYLIDHSGQSVSIHPFNDPWDSGFFGIIAVDVKKVKCEYGWKTITPKRRKQIERRLEGEVEVYDMYLRGDTYGWSIDVEDEGLAEIDDSCWGYFGEKSIPHMIEEAKSSVDFALAIMREKAQIHAEQAVMIEALAIV